MGVHRISDRAALGIGYGDGGSAQTPREEDQLTTGPVGCVTQIVHDESGRHQGIGDLVAPPEAQRQLRGQGRAVRLEVKIDRKDTRSSRMSVTSDQDSTAPTPETTARDSKPARFHCRHACTAGLRSRSQASTGPESGTGTPQG